MPRVLLLLLVLAVTGCSAARETTTSPAPPAVSTAEAVEEPAVSEPAEPEAPEPLPLAETPNQWLRLDADTDQVRGISLDRAYDLLGDRTPQRAVIVAVIDSGVDTTHPDLAERIWTNTGEIAGNGLDDDGNGYVDDTRGWSFLGNPDGENVQHDTYELTREVVRYREKFRETDPASLSESERADYERFREMEREFEQKRAEIKEMAAQIDEIDAVAQQATSILKAAHGTDTITSADLEPGVADSPEVQQAKAVLRYLDQFGVDAEQIAEEKRQVNNMLQYGYNPDFDPRPIVGDDEDDYSERIYGNPDATGPYASHGTSVASVIAAVRGNGLGIDGIGGDSVFVMPVRAVPSGDERDKDVANAIRYAVDNGALVVNMSFGKGYSPGKAAVDEAVRYAEQRGGLLVHAAGNDGADIDTEPNFPNASFSDGGRASNWIEVGATTSSEDVFAAPFSNYGRENVDLFAPGAEIDALDLEGGTTVADGTSLAAPVVSGVAALLLSHYPDLSPLDVREILLASATSYAGTTALRPGTDEPVDFGTLSVTGGVVNARRAVELAEARSGS